MNDRYFDGKNKIIWRKAWYLLRLTIIFFSFAISMLAILNTSSQAVGLDTPKIGAYDDTNVNLAVLAAETTIAETAAIPESVLGSWEPYSRNYQELGVLIINSDTITWGNCINTPYKIIRTENNIHYIELHPSKPCKVRRDSSFLIIDQRYEKLEVSVCRDLAEFNKVQKNRSCSWGVLYKRK